MVNTYNMITWYCEMKVAKATYDHHKYQEKISYGLIDTVHGWPRRGDCTPANNSKRNWQPQK